MSDLPKIPTDDPNQALAFCRALQQVLAGAEDRDAEKAQCPVLSIVVPVLNESENVLALYQRLRKVLIELKLEFELIFVDDGSTDDTAAKLHELQRADKSIAIIELARNFGHQAAFTAGLEHARGQAVVLMDGDLQDPPEVIPQFVKRWKEGADVVYVSRIKRHESPIKRACYVLFYRLLRLVATIRIPVDTGDFCLMDRRVVDQLSSMGERNRFIRGLRSWVGFAQVGIEMERPARLMGKSKYSVDRLLTLALDGLVSFSFRPLRAISLFGIAIAVVSAILAGFYIYQKMTVGLNPPGFASIVVLVLLLSGIQLITIGIIGEYVGRIFEETKRRPHYVVKQLTRD